MDGLEDAGAWALDIERARLPSSLAFPREGRVWEAMRDCELTFCPRIWKQPMKLESLNIRAGEKAQIVHLDGPKPDEPGPRSAFNSTELWTGWTGVGHKTNNHPVETSPIFHLQAGDKTQCPH